ncbi:MAG: NEW3 domain-containing protein, partial [Candidatus Limnocylindrales bacterium]
MRVLRAGAAALLLGLTLAPVALADGPLTLTTSYPSITADPGSTVRFPIVVVTDTPQRVDIAVTSAPAGWSVRLRGAGSTVSAVNTAPTPISSGSTSTQIQGTFTAEVTVPADVAPGSNQVVIQGRSAAGVTSTINLDLATEAQSAGAVSLTTDFPNLRGSTTTNFKYNLILKNDTNQQLTFGLETDAPPGWTVDAKPQGESQATTATVDAGATAPIQVTVDPPSDATAGTYNIAVRAQGGPAPVEADLTVEITGSYSLTMATSDQRLNANATAGGTSTLTLIVTNTGSAPLTNVKMTSSPPRGWKVTFDQETIATIPAGSATSAQAAVVVTIQPPANAVAGDYNL